MKAVVLDSEISGLKGFAWFAREKDKLGQITVKDVIRLRKMNTGKFPITGNILSGDYTLNYETLEKEVESLGLKKVFVPIHNVDNENFVLYIPSELNSFEKNDKNTFGGFVFEGETYFLF